MEVLCRRRIKGNLSIFVAHSTCFVKHLSKEFITLRRRRPYNTHRKNIHFHFSKEMFYVLFTF